MYILVSQFTDKSGEQLGRLSGIYNQFTMTSRTNVIYIRYDAVTVTYECMYQHDIVFIGNHIIKIVYSCFTVHRQKWGTVRTLEWHLQPVHNDIDNQRGLYTLRRRY